MFSLKRRIACAFAMAAGLAASAAAADADGRWTGPYVGFNLGGMKNGSDGTLSPSGNYLGVSFVANNPLRTDNLDFDGWGATGGLQGGYGHQFDIFVVGIEADFNYANKQETDFVYRTLSAPLVRDFTHTVTHRVQWFSTVRPRIGMAWGDAQFFATGGLAVARVKSESDTLFTSAGDRYYGSTQETQLGWTAGGGVEYEFDSNWSVKAEYLYMDLGQIKYTSSPPPAFPGFTYTTQFDVRENIGRLGLNYRF